jgi:hypothetical protein
MKPTTHRKPINLRLASLTLIALLSVQFLAGCFSPSQIHDGFVVAEAGLASSIQILTPVAPKIAAKLIDIKPVLKAADDATTAYFAAPGATTTEKAQAALAALSVALDEVYTLAGVDPKILAIVEAFVAVANTWLTVAQGHLPPAASGMASAAPQAQASGRRALPTVPGAKSPEDLKAYFNAKVIAAGHADSVIH